MNTKYERVGKGTPELAKNFERKSVRLALDLQGGEWFNGVEKSGDVTLDWYVRAPDKSFPGEGDVNIYQGTALVRKGKVHFYDRYPMGGGPFKVSDFKDPKFRKRAEIISDNIERLLKE